MNRDQKEVLVKELAEELSDSQAIFAVDYRGISVPQAAELRAELRNNADASFRVVKNRLTLRAADVAGAEPLKDWLEGPTALALVKGDAAAAAKTLTKLGSEFEVLDYKGGLMDGAVLEADDFKAIAKLPGRDQLNAQLAGMVASPITGLVRGLGSMIQGLALQLGQIAEQGLVSGEAPAEEPAAEEPAAEAGEDQDAEAPTEGKPEGDQDQPAEESESGDQDAEAPADGDPPKDEAPAEEEKPEEPEAAAEEAPAEEAPEEEKTEPEAEAPEASEETEDTKEDDQ